jgi:transcriptional regulator with XRE-family HTH domain
MVHALNLKQLRTTKGWSQEEAAKKLHVSQPYLSLLENGVREITPKLSRKLLRLLNLSPSFLPLPVNLDAWGEPKAEVLSKQLAALGYLPFGYLRTNSVRPENPAAILIWALAAHNLEPRLVESLPWILLNFHDLDTTWLIRESKIRDIQNRLGFIVSMAYEIATKNTGYCERTNPLTALLDTLNRSRLVHQDTLCEEGITPRIRKALLQSQSIAAEHWGIVTRWKAEHFKYDF